MAEDRGIWGPCMKKLYPPASILLVILVLNLPLLAASDSGLAAPSLVTPADNTFVADNTPTFS